MLLNENIISQGAMGTGVVLGSEGCARGPCAMGCGPHVCTGRRARARRRVFPCEIRHCDLLPHSCLCRVDCVRVSPSLSCRHHFHGEHRSSSTSSFTASSDSQVRHYSSLPGAAKAVFPEVWQLMLIFTSELKELIKFGMGAEVQKNRGVYMFIECWRDAKSLLFRFHVSLCSFFRLHFCRLGKKKPPKTVKMVSRLFNPFYL